MIFIALAPPPLLYCVVFTPFLYDLAVKPPPIALFIRLFSIHPLPFQLYKVKNNGEKSITTKGKFIEQLEKVGNLGKQLRIFLMLTSGAAFKDSSSPLIFLTPQLQSNYNFSQ